MNKKVDVIIPVYKPDQKFLSLLKRLKRQTYPVNRIIIMNTDPLAGMKQSTAAYQGHRFTIWKKRILITEEREIRGHPIAAGIL